MATAIHEQDFEKDVKVDLSIWKRLFRYALKYKKNMAALVGINIAIGIVDILYPLMNKYAIDHFIMEERTAGMPVFVALYLLFIAFQAYGVYVFVAKAGRIEMDVSFDIRQEGFKKLQELPFSFYDKTAVGYLMARMGSDVGRLSELIAWSIVDVLWASTYVVGVMFAMLFLNWKLALLAFVVLPPLAVISMYFQKKILKYQRRVRKANSRITGAFNEGIMGAMTTKTLVREDANYREFRGLTGDMRQSAVRSAVLSGIFMPIVMFLGSIGTGLALYRGGHAVLMEVLSFGTLSAFITYTTNFFEPVQQLAGILAELQSAQASAERVLTLIDTPCDIVDAPEVVAKYGDAFDPKRENWEPIRGEVEFKNVSFSYVEGETVLRDFDLHVKAGETIALVGETGAGKSTIVNLVCRFYEPTAGKILIDGRDYRERSQLWLQDSLGYVLQTPHLFSGTVADNIRYGRKDATDEEVRAAARMVHAEEFILRQEKGYDTEVGEGGVRLSTGEKQLISFARVILADPRIFVLDEATSSIDTETEQLIQDAITKVLENRTSFIVAHRLSTIRNADRILVIRGGKITESGTHRELLALHGYYYDLYTTQFREEAAGEILS
ncbi:MAG: ABC transporter ATP-binding protein [Clostridia bacterium]|nr:ABC transporter ATP-binding protein [Clostridia bacterium]